MPSKPPLDARPSFIERGHTGEPGFTRESASASARARLPGLHHRDALDRRRMRVEVDVRPGWRLGLLEARPRELLEEPPACRRVLRRLEGLPVGLRLHATRDDVADGRDED